MTPDSITAEVLQEESPRFIHLGEDLAEIERFDLLILRMHLFVEHYLDTVIENRFDDPEAILDDRDLGTFDAKLKLLEADGILAEYFDASDALVQNIRIINRVRNQIAHNLDWESIKADKIDNRIEAMDDLGTETRIIHQLEDRLGFSGTELAFIHHGFEVIIVLATVAALLDEDRSR